MQGIARGQLWLKRNLVFMTGNPFKPFRERVKAQLRVVTMRFPQLGAFAQQKVARIADFKVLDELFNEIVVAPDEQTVRTLLETLRA